MKWTATLTSATRAGLETRSGQAFWKATVYKGYGLQVRFTDHEVLHPTEGVCEVLGFDLSDPRQAKAEDDGVGVNLAKVEKCLINEVD